MVQRRIDEILEERQRPRNALEKLVKRNAAREIWTDQVRAAVSPRIAPHCRMADMRGQRLTIYVVGAAWANRLRFELPGLKATLRSLADFAALEEIRVVTMPRR